MKGDRLRLLLLSAYDAPSHRQWRESLCRGTPDWDWQVLTLPPRHFAWRVRGNSLHWSIAERETLNAEYDLLVATSMVDLATLRGLVPALSRVPSLLYFHENQFAYPEGRNLHGLLESQMVSLYSALAADCLVFNSNYNRSSFLEGCAALLQRLPDYIPTGIDASLADKSHVLAVPVDVPAVEPLTRPTEGLQLVWNHRWEYDKGPEQLLEIASLLLDKGIDFTLHVVGQQFREQPPALTELKERLEQGGALGHWGYLEDRETYFSLLAACDVVLSTALHDFQGLAILEACALRCTPLVPERLVYPDYFEPAFCYADSEDAVSKLLEWAAQRELGKALPVVDVGAFSSDALLGEYRALLHSQAQRNSVS